MTLTQSDMQSEGCGLRPLNNPPPTPRIDGTMSGNLVRLVNTRQFFIDRIYVVLLVLQELMPEPLQ